MPQYKVICSPFFVAYSLQNEKAVMKGYKYVNKKLKLVPQI